MRRVYEWSGFRGAHQFSSRAGLNDMWLEIDFNDSEFEMAVIRYIHHLLGRYYKPFQASQIEIHCPHLATKPRARTRPVTATGVRFSPSMVYIKLSDGREVGVPLSRLPWLAQASFRQRARWSIEPHGYAVWWDELDDGLEVCHLLDM